MGRGRDKITTKDARVLTGGHTVADHAELSRITASINAKSKDIKKGAKAGGGARGSPNEITKSKVLAKLKKSRVAVSTYRINK